MKALGEPRQLGTHSSTAERVLVAWLLLRRGATGALPAAGDSLPSEADVVAAVTASEALRGVWVDALKLRKAMAYEFRTRISTDASPSPDAAVLDHASLLLATAPRVSGLSTDGDSRPPALRQQASDSDGLSGLCDEALQFVRSRVEVDAMRKRLTLQQRRAAHRARGLYYAAEALRLHATDAPLAAHAHDAAASDARDEPGAGGDRRGALQPHHSLNCECAGEPHASRLRAAWASPRRSPRRSA